MDDFGFDGQGNLDVQDGSSVKDKDGKNDDANAQHLGVNDDPGKTDINNPGDTDNHDNQDNPDNLIFCSMHRAEEECHTASSQCR